MLLGKLVKALIGGAVLSPPEGSLTEAVRSVLADPSFQRTLPELQEPRIWALDLPEPLVVLLRIVVTAAVAIGLSVVAVWLYRRLADRERDLEAGDEARAAAVVIPIPRAEALAAAGRYAEAIHALLLETLDVLSGASRLAPSLTSREIVARVKVTPRAREALTDLVLAVEISRFGGVETGAGDYLRCLTRFRDFHATAPGV